MSIVENIIVTGGAGYVGSHTVAFSFSIDKLLMPFESVVSHAGPASTASWVSCCGAALSYDRAYGQCLLPHTSSKPLPYSHTL